MQHSNGAWSTKPRAVGSKFWLTTLPVLTAADRTLFLINELAHFQNRDFADVLIANIGKKPGALLVILTNAGYTDSFPFELRSVAGQSDRWYFSVTNMPPPWVDAADIAEQKKLLPPNFFRRLWQGEWVASDGDLFDEGALESSIMDQLGDHPLPRYQYAIGLKKDRPFGSPVASVPRRPAARTSP